MARVTFSSDQRTIDVEIGEKLVDVCHREQLSIPFGCQNGICGTCLSKVSKGRDALNPISEQEKETLDMFNATEEHRLICQCVVQKNDDIHVDDI